MFLGHPGPDDNVTIILQDIGHEDVSRVLEFVYTGAAVVPGHRMDGFVTAAGALGIGPLLDPRRHLEMSTVPPPPQPHPPSLSRLHPCPAADTVYESPSRPDPSPLPPRIRQPPRTTGILTPSPWAQNSRPPCAAPKYSVPRTAAVYAAQDSVTAAELTTTTTAVKVSHWSNSFSACIEFNGVDTTFSGWGGGR